MCRLDGGGVVQSVLEEGTQVSRGEAVVIFNNSQLQDKLEQQNALLRKNLPKRELFYYMASQDKATAMAECEARSDETRAKYLGVPAKKLRT